MFSIESGPWYSQKEVSRPFLSPSKLSNCDVVCNSSRTMEKSMTLCREG